MADEHDTVATKAPAEDRTCPVPGCDKPIKWDVFMCRQHWYQVPGPLRRDVNESWQERQRALRDPRADYEFAADRHERAKVAALQAIEERSDVR